MSALGDAFDFLDREDPVGIGDVVSAANLASLAFFDLKVPFDCLDACISSDMGLVKEIKPGVLGGLALDLVSSTDCCVLAAFLEADAFLPETPEATLAAALTASFSAFASVEGEATALRELGREWTGGVEGCICVGLIAAIMLMLSCCGEVKWSASVAWKNTSAYQMPCSVLCPVQRGQG